MDCDAHSTGRQINGYFPPWKKLITPPARINRVSAEFHDTLPGTLTLMVPDGHGDLSMQGLLERIQHGDILIADGAMGTMLQAAGLQPGECPELWCLTHPDVVKGISAAYLAAGSDVVETNSFGGTRYKLREFGCDAQVAELNRAAVALAKDVMVGKGYVAASVGPTGQIVEDEGGDVSEDDLYQAFAEQITALADGGADALCIETMSSVTEAVQAIKAAKTLTNLPVICTFTFEAGARGYRTMMGVDPTRAAEETLEAGVDIIGANCGNGIAGMIEIAGQLHAAAPNTPILVNANAGLPVFADGKTVFKETPEEMASRVAELLHAGVNIIGGCCGTTPAHIAAMAAAVRAVTVR
ncbi:MAG TPA: homocysteine S-methyltransferase family protein [Armatimonadota bacterium]|nr:homocysteine S-methyltransferase family protein [Armatimonadota bacterium]